MDFRKKEANQIDVKNFGHHLRTYVFTFLGVLYILTFVLKWTGRLFDSCVGILPNSIETIVFLSIIFLEIGAAITIWLIWARRMDSK